MEIRKIISKEKREMKIIKNNAQETGQKILKEIVDYYARLQNIPEEAAVKQIAQHGSSKRSSPNIRIALEKSRVTLFPPY